MNTLKLKILSATALISLAACKSDEPAMNSSGPDSGEGEIICIAESPASASRTYFESASAKTYTAVWADNDKLALSFDNSPQAREFTLLNGAGQSTATFRGHFPDSYSTVEAIYPYSAFTERTDAGIEIILPQAINYARDKVLSGAMPMYARGSGNALNFYNLAAVMKLSLTGDGLLKSVQVNALDGKSLSGTAIVSTDSYGMPNLSLTGSGEGISVDMGAIFLSSTGTEIFIPVPAATYDNGLRITFEFEGKTEVRELKEPLHFERSILRPVAPYQIEVPFDFSNYERKDNEIWFRSPEIQNLINDPDFGSKLLSYSYSPKTGLGLIVSESTITKIDEPFLDNPEEVTAIYLPETLQEIGGGVFENFGIEEFIAPPNLKSTGTDAFNLCSNLKRLVLNDGFESLGIGSFGDCKNLEYVYLPKSLNIIGAYSFLNSTGKLDHWDGDCPHIDSDRHALYMTSAYGIVNNSHTQIDVVAGCNLREYSIPQNVLYLQNHVFSGLVEMRKLIIHKDIISLGGWSFGNNDKMKVETIVCYAIEPPRTQIPWIDGGAIHPSYTSIKEIYVPKESLERYQKSENWALLADKFKPLP